MRNGNRTIPGSITPGLYVLTVPMRNGNIIEHFMEVTGKTGSYRTYEEWKLSKNRTVCGSVICSYRTYEEWKPYSQL